ncbi:YdcF family protein, partial [Streptococcus suis]|uniref:YdcF family protein n=1 Tax=Streptococcus suis TaxID=1307 RepID=UPI00137B1C75
MSMLYTTSSFVNLVNFFSGKLDYVVVLGAGLIGNKVTPLLASRIDKGIAIYQKQPGSKLIMSGGQGPDELIAEGQAMANYALEKGVPAEDIL